MKHTDVNFSTFKINKKSLKKKNFSEHNRINISSLTDCNSGGDKKYRVRKRRLLEVHRMLFSAVNCYIHTRILSISAPEHVLLHKKARPSK